MVAAEPDPVHETIANPAEALTLTVESIDPSSLAAVPLAPFQHQATKLPLLVFIGPLASAVNPSAISVTQPPPLSPSSLVEGREKVLLPLTAS